MRHAFALTLIAFTAACSPARQEVGVDVFSNDTLPSRFVVNVTGTLAIALRSNNFYMRPDKSLVLETPASLIIQKGEGTATIIPLDTTRPLAVQPIGTPLDSADVVGVVGRSVRMTRRGEEKMVKLELIKR